MARLKTTAPRGLIIPRGAPRPFLVRRYEPDPALAPYIEHHWVVQWSLPRGTHHNQRTLPDPVIHLVFEDGNVRVVGVTRRVFFRRTEGTGGVFGVKFCAGAFRLLMDQPASSLCDQMVPAERVLGRDVRALAAAIERNPDEHQRVALAEAFVRQRVPDRPPGDLHTLQAMVHAMATDATVLRVEDVVMRFGVGHRMLQRWFDDAVGVPPKWVIQRRRMHDALARLDADPMLEVASLAQDLGYFDQAHFSRDFRALVGMTPGAYRRGTPATPAGPAADATSAPA